MLKGLKIDQIQKDKDFTSFVNTLKNFVSQLVFDTSLYVSMDDEKSKKQGEVKNAPNKEFNVEFLHELLEQSSGVLKPTMTII
jgi:hypothetical protein|tara:strand:- start:1085 stop:1333 length:249 start_codon:yes stop_codon:yes gene_type:complete